MHSLLRFIILPLNIHKKSFQFKCYSVVCIATTYACMQDPVPGHVRSMSAQQSSRK